MIPYNLHVFERYTTIEFEGREVMIIRDYIDYLQTRFNRVDFHEPEDEQIPTHFSYVNLNMPYKEYMRTKESLK